VKSRKKRQALLLGATPEERDELKQLFSKMGKVMWTPHPDNEPQQRAYDLADKVDELGYGGQAGGGKTDLILGLAATKFKRSLIFRREFPQLSGIIDRGNVIYPVGFVEGSKRRWEFDGRIIGTGSMQYEKDWVKYQGRESDMIAFDESAQFNEMQVRSVSAWNRTADASQHTLVLYCFNPPTTVEGEWIINYFAPWLDDTHPNPAEPGEIRYFAFVDDKNIEVESGESFEHNGQTIHPISRTFIPASREDNPFLREEYERRLQNLPEPLRSQLLNGSFTVGFGDDAYQVIPTMWVRIAQQRWESMERPDGLLTAIGCDPSRGGKDETVIAKRYGNWFDELIREPGKSMPDGQAVARLIMNNLDRPTVLLNIEVDGIGASVVDIMKADYNVVQIQAGSKSLETDKTGILTFRNKRAELWWKFRGALDPDSGDDIALPPDTKLRADLCAPHWEPTVSGILIEKKDRIKKRIGRSPDSADAVIMAYHFRVPDDWSSAVITSERDMGRLI